MTDTKKIIKELDEKFNADDFCNWLLFYHIDEFKKLHNRYLRESLTPNEIKDFVLDWNMLKEEIN